MKKKLMISLLVVCVLLPAALSAAVLDLSLGVTAQYKDSLGKIKTAIDSDNFDGLANFDNYALGADVRFKLLIAEVDLVGKFSQETIGSVDYTKIEVLSTAGVSMDLLGFTRLGFGMGPNWIVRMDKDGKFTIFDANDNPQTLSSLGETFINSPVAYRATLDFNLGKLMLGLNYTLETDYTFKKPGEVDKLFNAKMDDGTVGVSLLFSLF
jgi:hypothetical protein